MPGGTYYRIVDELGTKAYPGTISSFALDKYEITVGRFRAFVNAGMGTQTSPPAAGAGAHPLIAGSGWDSSWDTNLPADAASLKSAVNCLSTYATWTGAPGANESQPINCITWYEAFAFCAWDEGRLATEAEWGFAAAGGSEQRYYPWSSPPTSTMIDDTYAVYCPGGALCNRTENVGTRSPKGDGKWGHADLAGNVWEWTLDYYTEPISPTACIDCANLADVDGRSLRGGSVNSTAPYLQSSSRTYTGMLARGRDIGSRCARSAP